MKGYALKNNGKISQIIGLTLAVLLLASACTPAAAPAPIFVTQLVTATFPPPTDTPQPPTSTPTAIPSLTPTPTQDVEGDRETFQALIIMDLTSQHIAATGDAFDQGQITRVQADARIQYFEHALVIVEAAFKKPGAFPYKEDYLKVMTAVSEECDHWWRGQADGKNLSTNLTKIRQTIQSLEDPLRARLIESGKMDLSVEQNARDKFNQSETTPEKELAYISMHDLFATQRARGLEALGVAAIVGHNDLNSGYTAPDGSFICRFSFTGSRGEALYDTVLPDRFQAIFTDILGLGQAVERIPLPHALPDTALAQKLDNAYYEKDLLPLLKQQHSGLVVMQKKWVETPRPMLQVIFKLPKAAFFFQSGNDSNTPTEDVIRGYWIFVDGSGLYSIVHQGYYNWPSGSGLPEENLSDAKRVEIVLAGLSSLEQTCSFETGQGSITRRLPDPVLAAFRPLGASALASVLYRGF